MLGPGPEDLEAMGGNIMDSSRRIRRAGDLAAHVPRGPARPRPGRPDHLADVSLIRAYVPSTLPEVTDWHARGRVPAGTRISAGHSGLREAHPGADEEELEFPGHKAAEESRRWRP